MCKLVFAKETPGEMEPFCSQAVVPGPAPPPHLSLPIVWHCVLLSRVLTVCSPGAAGTVAPGVLSNARSPGDSVVLSPSPPFAAGLRAAAGDAKQESWEQMEVRVHFQALVTVACDRPVMDHGGQVSPQHVSFQCKPTASHLRHFRILAPRGTSIDPPRSQ